MTTQASTSPPASAASKTEERQSHSADDSPKPASRSNRATETPPKKKRKVNHACVYCRRSHMTCDSERPCKRCIKRNIGHLCHDEPREPAHRKSKGGDSDAVPTPEQQGQRPSIATDTIAPVQVGPNGSILQTSPTNGLSTANSIPQNAGLNGIGHNRYNLTEPFYGAQNSLQDIHNFHPNYMFNANELSDEYNLLNDFLSSSLFEETGVYAAEDMTAYNDPTFMNSMNVSLGNTNGDNIPHTQPLLHQQLNLGQAIQGALISRPGSVKPISDKAREKYYMTAADPSGTDPPEERMNKLLKAKYDAGMLKPFNYVNGYARLNKFMEKNIRSSSRHKILLQLDKFRPKFRERMQTLTDIELVLVEMRFERSLMEYDRIFASMAIPACCWRRTGEIFRGNKEMAELINVPMESLRDGKLAIHDFIVEDQLVSYWEKFCAICFDQQQKAMLTSCTLKSPTAGADGKDIHCCFSFTIKRDAHNVPSLIIGNFLPMDDVSR